METTTTTPVKSVENIMDTIALRKSTDQTRIQNEINRMMDLNTITNAYVSRLETKLPSLVAVLSKMGLGLVEFGYGKTGMNDKAWGPDDSLRVHMTAVPTSDKFKFLQDQGYDSRGRGKNYERLNAKASKIGDAIKKATDIESVHVNPFSLEIKRDDDQVRRVLIEMWIK